jgi:hypothetical protein
LRELPDGAVLSIKGIAKGFIERHGEDFVRKITPHWIGQVIRRKLGLKTERRDRGYMIATSEGPKLMRLFEKYGIPGLGMNPMNSMNSHGEEEGPADRQEPLPI